MTLTQANHKQLNLHWEVDVHYAYFFEQFLDETFVTITAYIFA